MAKRVRRTSHTAQKCPSRQVLFRDDLIRSPDRQIHSLRKSLTLKLRRMPPTLLSSMVPSFASGTGDFPQCEHDRRKPILVRRRVPRIVRYRRHIAINPRTARAYVIIFRVISWDKHLSISGVRGSCAGLQSIHFGAIDLTCPWHRF